MSKHDFLYVSQNSLIKSGALVMEDVIQDLEVSFTLHHEREYVMPGKAVLRWGDKDSEATRGRINAMPGYLGGAVDIAGIKWIGSAPGNPVKYRLPRASALIILNDPETMVPVAVMDGTVISAMRTGAVTGVAAKYLARPDASTVGLIGAGTQNRTQLMALRAVLPNLSEVKVYDLDSERSNAFAQAAQDHLRINVTPVQSGEEAVRQSDVIVTATTAKSPIVKAEWIEEGCFYSHVGGYEAEFAVVDRADKIVVDDWEQIKHRGAQTLALMAEQRWLKPEHIHAQLGTIIAGEKQGREHDREFIYFSSVGLALHDLVVAKRLYDDAKDKGLGTYLNLWDEPVFV